MTVTRKTRTRLSPKEQARIAEIFDRLAAALPEPKTELNYISP
jgi:hypothetical protein